ncbi:MAG TPA: thiosulfate oxidation carrier complex protein SoxZ [Gammaproteobacteria bacterium]|jgi:sulfur-oxidizing protein SoxZ
MGDSIRIRTSHRDGLTTVRAIIRHPMDTGFAKDPETGAVIPMYFIREVTCTHGEEVILRCQWSRAVSRNPYLSFEFAGARPGDPLTISWRDSREQSDTATIAIQ